MPGAVTWAILLVAAPQTFPSMANVVAGLPLVLLIMIARSTQVKRNHPRTLENKIYCSQIIEGTQHSRGPHSEVVGRGVWGVSPDLGFCLY